MSLTKSDINSIVLAAKNAIANGAYKASKRHSYGGDLECLCDYKLMRKYAEILCAYEFDGEEETDSTFTYQVFFNSENLFVPTSIDLVDEDGETIILTISTSGNNLTALQSIVNGINAASDEYTASYEVVGGGYYNLNISAPCSKQRLTWTYHSTVTSSNIDLEFDLVSLGVCQFDTSNCITEEEMEEVYQALKQLIYQS